MRERLGPRRGLGRRGASATFWIGGFHGGYERFELRDRILRHGHEPGPGIADDLPRRILPPSAVETLWRTIKTSGCWGWTEPPFDGTVDGTQWKLRLRDGTRSLDLYGSNAYPPGGTADESLEFKQLLGAFRAAAGIPDPPTESR